MMRYMDVLDKARLGSWHWRLFAIVSANYFLDGIMFSIAPLIAYMVSVEWGPAIFALNLVSETLGSIVLGRLADVYGRRRLFIIALAIEVASLILLFPLYNNVVALAILTSAMTFGIGGEFGAAYAALAELMPSRHRGKLILISTNFWNVGASFIAGMSMIYAAINENPDVQVRMMLATALGTAVIVGFARLGFPESPRWLLAKGLKSDAEMLIRDITGYTGDLDLTPPETSIVPFRKALSLYAFRFVILAVVTVAQYVTYGMAAYYAPYAQGFKFPTDKIPFLIFIANLGASLGAIPLILFIDKSRRYSLLLSFLGGTITAVALILAHDTGVLGLYSLILFINLFFSEWAWGSISALQSELFPTSVRAGMVGVLVGLTGISGALVVYLENIISAQGFLTLASALWALGLASSITWLIKGRESAGLSVEALEEV